MKNRRFNSSKKNKSVILLILFIIFIVLFCGIYIFTQYSSVPVVQEKPNNCYDKTITVVADYDYDPYSFIDEDGNMSGHDVEFIYKIANEMKVNIYLKLMNWSDAQKAVADGKADVIMGLEYANEEAKIYNLTIPFNTDQFLCFGKKNYDYLNELSGKRIATLDENKNYEYIFSTAENIPCDSYSQAFQMAENGDVDYVICRYAVGRRLTADLSDDSIKAVGPTLTNDELCYGVRRDEPELCDEINSAMKRLLDEGYVEKLSNKWLGKYIQVISIRDFIGKYKVFFVCGIGLLVLIILMLLIVVNSRMRKAKETAEVNEKCIEILSQKTGNAIFEMDINSGKIVLAVNFDKFFPLFEDDFAAFSNNGSKSDMEKLSEIRSRLRAGEKITEERFKFEDKDGTACWYELTTVTVNDSDGKPVRIVGSFENANERVNREEHLKSIAEHDLLTGLYNKLTTERMISECISEGNTDHAALFMIDIDNLKKVNDGYGHMYGDMVIKKIAADLRSIFRNEDIIGRIGGDEFIVFIRNINMEVLEKRASDICRNYHDIVSAGGREFETSASVGVAVSRAGEDFQSMYRRADEALYSIKRNGKNNYSISE